MEKNYKEENGINPEGHFGWEEENRHRVAGSNKLIAAIRNHPELKELLAQAELKPFLRAQSFEKMLERIGIESVPKEYTTDNIDDILQQVRSKLSYITSTRNIENLEFRKINGVTSWVLRGTPGLKSWEDAIIEQVKRQVVQTMSQEDTEFAQLMNELSTRSFGSPYKLPEFEFVKMYLALGKDVEKIEAVLRARSADEAGNPTPEATKNTDSARFYELVNAFELFSKLHDVENIDTPGLWKQLRRFDKFIQEVPITGATSYARQEEKGYPFQKAYEIYQENPRSPGALKNLYEAWKISDSFSYSLRDILQPKNPNITPRPKTIDSEAVNSYFGQVSDIPRDEASRILAFVERHSTLCNAIIPQGGYRDTQTPTKIPELQKVEKTGINLHYAFLLEDMNEAIKIMIAAANDEDAKNKLINHLSPELTAIATPLEIDAFSSGEYLPKKLETYLKKKLELSIIPECTFLTHVSDAADIQRLIDLKLDTKNPELIGWLAKIQELTSDVTALKAFADIAQSSSWHDALYWIGSYNENIEPSHIHNLLTSALHSERDFNTFKREIDQYRYLQDKHAATLGAVTTLSELKARNQLIRETIDFSDLPDSILKVLGTKSLDQKRLVEFTKTGKGSDLLSGKYDLTQPFEPFSYTVYGHSAEQIIKQALDSKGRTITPAASAPTVLFRTLKQLITGRENDSGEQMQVSDLFQQCPDDLRQKIVEIIKKDHNANGQVQFGTETVASILPKSDPRGWVCGNATDCCMGFGTSKNDDYMTHPDTQYFIVEMNGVTVAQSVMVRVKNKQGVESILLDNIEVSNIGKKNIGLIDQAYREAFGYKYPDTQIVIGMGYSDLTPAGTTKVTNTVTPVTKKLSYSDATGSHLYELKKTNFNMPSQEPGVMFANASEVEAERFARLVAKSGKGEKGSSHYRTQLKNIRENTDSDGHESPFIIMKNGKDIGFVLMHYQENYSHSDSDNDEAIEIQEIKLLPNFVTPKVIIDILEHVFSSAEVGDDDIIISDKNETIKKFLDADFVAQFAEKKGFQKSNDPSQLRFIKKEQP
jgi:hypothetical protein